MMTITIEQLTPVFAGTASDACPGTMPAAYSHSMVPGGLEVMS